MRFEYDLGGREAWVATRDRNQELTALFQAEIKRTFGIDLELSEL
jgi:hypothetical protein